MRATPGLRLVGDALCTTNRSMGRGISLAVFAVHGLSDALAAAADPADVAAPYAAPVRRNVVPHSPMALAMDRARQRSWDSVLGFADPVPPPRRDAEGVSMQDVFAAVTGDRQVWCRGIRAITMLDDPTETVRDPDVVRRVTEVRAVGLASPPPPLPTRDEMLAAAGTFAG